MTFSKETQKSTARVWSELKSRGFVFDWSDQKALAQASAQPLVVYAGFDLTAESLHVGHLMVLMALRHIQKAGHAVIALLGGATTRIGDPSDKKSARPVLGDEVIEKNRLGIKKTLSAFLCEGEVQIVDNIAWLGEVKYLDFLRDVASQFSVPRMLSFDFIKRRLENNQSFSFLEMNYILLQSYDFLKLFQKFGCTVQIGGQDQWANILSGIDLVRRKCDAQAFGLTLPLVKKSSGEKMGKTSSGAVWLDPKKCSAYEFWQFWRNTADADVQKFLLLFTFLDAQEIEAMTASDGADFNKAKIVLANEVTLLVHGQESLSKAQKKSQSIFRGGETLEADVVIASEDSKKILDVLLSLGFCASKSEGRRLVRAKSVRLNDVCVLNEEMSVSDLKDALIKVSVGKKKHVIIKVLS